METEKDAIIVGSLGTFSLGVSIRNLHNLIFASPSKGRIRILQSIGRSLRLGTEDSDKEFATLYDLSDNLSYRKHTNFTLRHFIGRIRIYISESFPYKIYNIDLEE